MAYRDLLRWRNTLGACLQEMEEGDPVEWGRWRRPGTFLDSLLRFRSLVSHVVAKAYWDEKEEIAFDEIDVERYLWGAR